MEIRTDYVSYPMYIYKWKLKSVSVTVSLWRHRFPTYVRSEKNALNFSVPRLKSKSEKNESNKKTALQGVLYVLT